MEIDYVILVTDNDMPLGTMEKMEAHERGKLHRAFSVFIFNNNGEMMLQKRAGSKYHSPGLWTNTVCSHPHPGESTKDAAHRRLMEEMGFDCDIEEVFSFKYKANVGNGLIEHEYDHVFTGVTDKKPVPNPEEVSEWKYITVKDVLQDTKRNPGNYTEWFKIALKQLVNHINK
jgi:isopentenyl-diphosphate delta-isomerase